MSQVLVNAAARGDINEVSRLLKNKSINVNFIGEYNVTPLDSFTRPMPVTALSIAAHMGNADMVRLLLTHGAQIDPNPGTIYDYPGWAKNAFLTAVFSAYKVSNLESLYFLFQQTANLLPQAKSGFSGDVEYSLKHSNLRMFLPLLIEAISRNSKMFIDQFHPYAGSMLTAEAIKLFVKYRPMTVQSAQMMCNGFDYLVQQSHLTRESSAEFKKILGDSIVFKLELDAFPDELKPYLQKPSARRLEEVFARFRAYFCPDEHLPKVLIDSQAFQQLNDKESYIDPEKVTESISSIRAKQHPVELGKLLSLNMNDIIIRIGACSVEGGINEAALLLAEMLLFHRDAKLNINGNIVPLLSEEQQKLCLRVLTKLYALTDFELVSLSVSVYKKQELYFSELKNDHLVLQTQNAELAEKVGVLEIKLNELMAQNQRIFMLLMEQSRLNTDEMDEDRLGKKPRIDPRRDAQEGHKLFGKK